VSDTPDTQPDQRPAHACLTCAPPKTRAWWPADPGYRTCSTCYDKIRELLAEINRRYMQLDPAPGGSGEHGSRGAPGFGSRPAASPHIITMRDRRSSSVAHVWVGKDGRVHQEPERPPLSVPGVLDTLAWDVAEHRGQDGPDPRWRVHQLVAYLDSNLDWSTRQASVVDLSDALRALAAQLRPVTGEPGRRHIGLCPVVIDEGETTRECGARLYAPLKGDQIECGACGETWAREKWLRLGDLLQDAS
jgi:hypothetical protein